jgi:FkbM family methyltransferase
MEVTPPDLVSSAIYLTGRWEPVVTKYIRKYLKPSDVFIDCGANIGYYTLIASRIVGLNGKVFSIEASDRIYKRMVRNLHLNGCRNVVAIHAAASGEEGELSTYLAPEWNLGHSTTVETLAYKEGMVFETKVRANTLENLVGSSNLRAARIIKLDVEGAERTVLAPLFKSLDQFSPDTEWLIELSPGFSPGGQDDVNKIFGAFCDAGYTGYQIPNVYEMQFILSPPANPVFVQLNEPPTELCDVLMSRRSGVRL